MLQMACTEHKVKDFGGFFSQMIVLGKGNSSGGLAPPKAEWPWVSFLTRDTLASSRRHGG